MGSNPLLLQDLVIILDSFAQEGLEWNACHATKVNKVFISTLISVPQTSMRLEFLKEFRILCSKICCVVVVYYCST